MTQNDQKPPHPFDTLRPFLVGIGASLPAEACELLIEDDLYRILPMFPEGMTGGLIRAVAALRGWPGEHVQGAIRYMASMQHARVATGADGTSRLVPGRMHFASVPRAGQQDAPAFTGAPAATHDPRQTT